jgi:hypothetical protein
MELAGRGRIKNCDVTRQDIVNAEDIFGPDSGSLKGKTVRKASDQVRSGGLVPIPATIMDHYRRIVLCVDVMKVNKIPFLVSISRAIKFGTVAWLKNSKAPAILDCIKTVRNIYVKRGFILEIIEVDGQFEPLRGDLAEMGITLNKCSREEHVPVAERRIRTLKERCRSISNTLPFPKLPTRLTIQMVSTCNFWLNIFPPTDGISRNINPRELITGIQIDYNKHIRAEFGEYVQVHEEHDNSMKTRTTGAIATKPTGNAQGGHWFYSLTTGRMLDRMRWTPLPMPADVIARVATLAKNNPVGLNFTNMRNEPYEDIDSDDDSDDDDSDYDSDDTDSAGDDDDYDDFIAGVDRQDNANADENLHNNDDDEEDDQEPHDEDDQEPHDEDDPPDEEDPTDDGEGPPDDEGPPAEANDDSEATTPVIPATLKKLADYNGVLPTIIGSRTRQQAQNTGESSLFATDEPEWITPSKKQRRIQRELQKQALRSAEEEAKRKLKNKTKNEKRRMKIKDRKKAEKITSVSNEMEIPNPCEDLRDQLRAKQKPGVSFPHDSCSSKELAPELEAIALTQYTLKKGLKEFGKEGLVALGKEVEQLYTRKVSKPVDGDDLTREQKRASLRYLMFLTQKRCGRIKARGCADGRKQRETTNKEDASAPTVSIEAVMLSSTIDAFEGRDVVTADIPGAFMQADIDEVVHVKFEGEIAEMLVRMDPALYRKYVKDENGKTVLYVELLKALYGTLKAALLFWKLLSGKLVSWGFEINPYDWCVANKMINGKQCTILWHVDDLKISHVDPEVNTTILGLIDAEFGKEAPLTVTRGKIHEYLGMTLDFTTKGKVKIIMIDYAKKMIIDIPEEFAEEFDGEAPTPAANHLFTVDENQTKLDEKRAQFFHTYVAKTLFLCKRARPDLQTVVSFLCKRVKDCDEDDWKKLKRMIQFIRATKDDYLTLSATSLHTVRWWVDAAYAVHPDMKSHTGGAMSMGLGVIYGTAKGQKLNTKSSTEAELVGTDDVMPQVLWTLYFLEAQGYKIDDNILYQDNKSSILLETNGRGSSGKRTRHINVRYFFIADRVKSGEVRIEHCPTGIMIADYFTKALQGALFWKLRDMIMGNTLIALPSDASKTVDDPSIGIPNGLTTSESRSVLKDEIVNDNISSRSLTVLPAFGLKRNKTKTTASDIKDSKPVPSKILDGKLMVEKRTVSWAEIASRGTRGD